MTDQGNQPEPAQLPRGTCATCHREGALRNGGIMREHTAEVGGPICQGSGQLALPAGETLSEPDGQAQDVAPVPLEPDRPDTAEVIGVAYLEAPDVEAVARELIDGCEELHWLSGPDGPRIAYLAKLKGQVKADDRHTLGKALKASEPWGMLAGLDAVLWVHRGSWRDMKAEVRRALLHHELMHLDQDEESGELLIRGHDLEEFAGTVRRFGAWEPAIAHLAEQLKLFETMGGLAPVKARRSRRA